MTRTLASESPAGLRRLVQDLEQRLATAEATVLALVSQQVDAVASPQGGTPLLLRDAQEALRRSEERYRCLVELSPSGILVQQQGRFVFVNPALVALLGARGPEDLAGRAVLDFIHPSSRGLVLERMHRIQTERCTNPFVEERWLRTDGTAIDVEVGAISLSHEEGTGVLAVIRDITERKQAEEQLRQTEKLATMGQLLAGVAHELNNPLSIVMGHSTLLRLAVGEGPLGSRAEKIMDAADRCARIVRNFLALVRQRPPERQPVALNQVSQEAIELVAYPLRVSTIQVTLHLAPDLPVLWADSHQLHQVVVNLITNAEQAMRGTPHPRRLILTTRFDPAHNRIAMEVADSGPGIPPEIQPRVFEPFFTTKPPGQGTGLGLSLCQGIVEGHGGSIRVSSPPGQGATFLIELPVAAPPTAAVEAPAAAEAAPIRGKAILVVDDEPVVLEILVDLLSIDGHAVDVAANGAIAVERIREKAYDVILSDVRMPDLDGPGLYREIERHRPELLQRLIFVTGDALSQETREFLKRIGAPTLEKPFILADIQRVVRQVVLAAESTQGATSSARHMPRPA